MKRLIGIIYFIFIIMVDAAHIDLKLQWWFIFLNNAAIISSVNHHESHNRANLYLHLVEVLHFQIYQNKSRRLNFDLLLVLSWGIRILTSVNISHLTFPSRHEDNCLVLRRIHRNNIKSNPRWLQVFTNLDPNIDKTVRRLLVHR